MQTFDCTFTTIQPGDVISPIDGYDTLIGQRQSIEYYTHDTESGDTLFNTLSDAIEAARGKANSVSIQIPNIDGSIHVLNFNVVG